MWLAGSHSLCFYIYLIHSANKHKDEVVFLYVTNFPVVKQLAPELGEREAEIDVGKTTGHNRKNKTET